jgi:hypothetical protein
MGRMGELLTGSPKPDKELNFECGQPLKQCSLTTVTKPRPADPLVQQRRDLVCPSPLPVPQHRANSVRICEIELSSQTAMTKATVMVSLHSITCVDTKVSL